MSYSQVLVHSLLLAAIATVTSACSNDSGGGTPAMAMPVTVGVPGVTLTRVTIFQGIERELMLDGTVPVGGVQLVAGRDALVRLHYRTEGYDGAEVIGRVTVDDGAPIEVKATLAGASTQSQLASTVNVRIPGDRVAASLSFSAGLVRDVLPTGLTAPESNAAARWPADGGRQSIEVGGPKNTLRVLLVPFAYDYDRSGRVPDTSDRQVEKVRQRFYQLYPVSQVEVRVHEVVPWSGRLQRDGSGWEAVGQALAGMRDLDGEPADVYYYALFNPATSLNAYCGQGCLLGVTLLNNAPDDIGDPGLRLALGVGFLETAADTAAHEIGHSHGLMHANCGQGLDPNSIDQDFPYVGGGIGLWGYDLVANKLIAPTGYSDVMGYCDRQWISDYHYEKLLYRGRNVNLPRWRQSPGAQDGEPVVQDIVSIDASGNARITGTIRSRASAAANDANQVSVALSDGDGRVVSAAGQYHPWDHMRGGWLMVPRPAAMSAAPVRAAFAIEGRPRVALPVQ